MAGKAVIPLESNPEIFNCLAGKLGLSPVLEFYDVYSLTDPDLLAFLPQPTFGLILLFPISENYEEYRKKTDEFENEYDNELFDQIKWVKQTIRNGCGLYALLHILINLPRDTLMENLIIRKFISKLSPSISPEESAKFVEELESSIKLDENYGEKGQTEAPAAEESIDFHFISFIKGKDNNIYELDGRRKGPINLGKSTSETNIVDEKELIKKIQFYMDNADEANKHKFAIMAVGPSQD